MMKFFNEIDYLYEQPVLSDSTRMYCPVCGKGYKNKKSFDKHLNQKNCHSYVQLFQDTITEGYMLDCFKEICTDFNIKGSKTKQTFRKSRYYKPLAQLFVYWSRNKMDMQYVPLYILFAANKLSYKNLIQLLYMVDDDRMLRKFRKHLIQNEHLINSERFFNQAKEKIEEDPSFMIRALERGDIGFNYLMNKIDLESMVDKMTPAEEQRLSEFMNIIKWR